MSQGVSGGFPARSDKKRILLLVEDNDVNLRLLSKILESEYTLLTAKNGQIALDILNSAEENSISAVVLDLVMPVMDGYETLRRMRADQRLMQIPVIVASSPDSEEDNREELALALGANDYVTKPYKPQIIRHRIANTIYLRETAAFVNTVQHDELTCLFSKEYFYLRAKEILQNNPDEKYDMICCDIEQFKLVNDLYGMDVGDELLKRCAGVFRKNIGTRGICGRIGPDIFAFLVLHLDSYCDEYFSSVIEQVNRHTLHLNIQLRYGIYVVERPLIPVNIMCDRACLAIASIKGKYNTYYKYYDEIIRQNLVHEQYIVSHMKQALENGEFETYFQPKYDLKTEKIIGAEALIRWNSPEKGFLSPGAFIPLFEKNGFISDLDLYVWDTCCKKIRAWLDQGHAAVPLSVNVSRADLYNPAIDRIFAFLLEKYNLSTRYLYLEITESAYTENSQQIIETIWKLKRLGFRIEMDDFGTGYSSLNMLSDLPIDLVKLDMGFMQNKKKSGDRNVLSFIISLAQWMNLGVIAEGVETAEQVSLLRSLNCECAQGFYFAKPMPAQQFEELLLEQRSQETPAAKLRKETEYLPADLRPCGILVFDREEKDYSEFKAMFAEEHFILRNTSSMGETVELIDRQKTNIRAVICVVDETITEQTLRELVNRCANYQIPVLTVHSSPYEVDAAIDCGVFDYIIRPYHNQAIKNRIKNSIQNFQVSPFDVEKQLSSAIAQMKKLAEQDSLTDLLNRTEFEYRMQEFFAHQKALNGFLLLLDVDNFSYLNDVCGHAAGDITLQSIAKKLSELFDEANIIGRIGGDEFALFLPYETDRAKLEAKVAKLCGDLELNVNTMPVSCSVGISVYPEDGKDFEALHESATLALLHAKRDGKSQYQFYRIGMEIPIDEQLEKRAGMLLDGTSDAMFISDAVTSEIIYINNAACQMIHSDRKSCLGARCYQLFWNQCQNCDRCSSIDKAVEDFYEENILMKDDKTRVHLRAKMDVWDGRRLKIHYLQIRTPYSAEEGQP